MKKILLISILFSVASFADDKVLLPPNTHLTTSGWVNGKYVTKHTTVDSTGRSATTSGWVTDSEGQTRYETDHTVINSNGRTATTSGWHNGEFIIKHTTIK